MDFIYIENFCAAKGHCQESKKTASEREKLFAKHSSDKDLVSRIYKLNNKDNSIEKLAGLE